MKKHASFIFGLGFICLCVCFANAQEGDQPKGPLQGGDGAGRLAEFVKRADSDGDGKISKEEFAGMSRKETDERFTRADANADGFIDQAEFGQIAQRMRDTGGGGGMRRPEGEGGFRRPPGSPERGNPPPASPEGARPQGAPEGGRPPGGPEGGRPGFDSPGGKEGGRLGFAGRGMFGDPKESFKRMDTDANGSVSEEEYVTAIQKLREMMGRGGPSGQGAPGGDGGFRRPGGEGGRPPGGGESGFRRPPVEDGKSEGEKPASDKTKDAVR